jgi:anti-sigma regulatory factor (Ser/Thr protein kinase)
MGAVGGQSRNEGVSGSGDDVGGETPRDPGAGRGWTTAPASPFCHHGLLYEGEAEYLALATDFVREGVRQGDQVLVLASPARLAVLQEAVGSEPGVRLADAGPFGWNPGRALPVWADFVDSLGPDTRGRGLAEPVSTVGRAVVGAERAIHESLLNLAFAERHPFWLVCPYDLAALGDLAEGPFGSSHQFVTRNGRAASSSPNYRVPEADHIFGPSAGAFAEPAPSAERFRVEQAGLGGLRHRVRARAQSLGVEDASAADFALAVHEVAANSIRHGGGAGRVTLWEEDGVLVCEVSDHGHFDAPFAGRVPPSKDGGGGRGLWIAQQLSDLLQIRSVPDGTIVRLHLSLEPSAGDAGSPAG